MTRRLAALAAVLTLFAPPAPARAQEAKPADPAPAAPAASELDPKTRAAIAREVEKAKEELRDEVRAEMQGAQSAAEFLGAVAEGPKLEFLELDGYLRFRGQMTVGLDLGAGTDAAGFYYYPKPRFDPNGRDTLATANMRFRLEPTLNVSEHVRVRAQLDVFDNAAYGSSPSTLMDAPGSPFPVLFYGGTRAVTVRDPRLDRDPVQAKRAWGEVQTPLGLLSFGRMPSSWGLGILTHAGQGLDDDYGDTVDRLQFALPPVQTPIGALNFVPILDFVSEGVLNADPRFGAGVGQPFDADSADDARTFAFKVARVDTDDELRRKLDAGRSSLNFGAYYNYHTQRYTFPEWLSQGYFANITTAPGDFVKRGSYGHVLDVWGRFQTARLRVEGELVGVYGHVGQAFTLAPENDTEGAAIVPKPLGRVLLRQWGGSLVTEYKAIPNKLLLGLDLGVASGDAAPGFGNQPNRFGWDVTADPVPGSPAEGAIVLPELGSIEGPQFGRTGDRSIRNFRFNPGYRVDLVLWRNILGQVTDAWYLRPHLRWDVVPGLVFDGAIVYSQALYGQSTPSASEAVYENEDGTGALLVAENTGKKALGVEVDGRLTWSAGDGFAAWGEWGILQPLDGLGKGLSRGHVVNVGMAIRF